MKNQAKWAGQIRHILTIIGAALVAGNFAEAGVADEIIGGAMAFTGLVLSWISPAKNVGEGD